MSTAPVEQKSEPASEAVAEEHAPHVVKDDMNSKAWQLLTLLVPILLTTFLAFWVSLKEDSIKQHIDTQSQIFQQQLQLSEELYKRRFDAYDKLYVQLAELNDKLSSDKESGETAANADSAMQISQLITLSKLHMSADIETKSDEAWRAAVHQDAASLSDSLETLKAAMKQELDDWMLEKKLAPASAPAGSTPSKPKRAKANANTGSSR